MATKINRLKLIIRGLLFFTYAFLYFFNRQYLIEIIEWRIEHSAITPLHIAWLFLMLELIVVPIPSLNYYISRGKQFKSYYASAPNIAEESQALAQHTKLMNRRAAATMGLWLILTGIIGFLYIKDIIGELEMYLAMLFFYFGDMICINIWCPFQFFIMKEKCCNTCRLYNWGHFMMYSHFVFIPNFFTLSLFGMSLLILIQWEYMHHKHPDRFYEGTNLNLRCSRCKDRGCKIRHRSNSVMGRIYTKIPLPSMIRGKLINNFYNYNKFIMK